MHRDEDVGTGGRGVEDEPGAAPLTGETTDRRGFLEHGVRWSAAALAALAGLDLVRGRSARASPSAGAYYYAWSAYHNWNAYSNWNAYYNWTAYYNWNAYYNWVAWSNIRLDKVERGQWSESTRAGSLVDASEAVDSFLARFVAEEGLERFSTMLRRGVALVRQGGRGREEGLGLIREAGRGLVLDDDRRDRLKKFANRHGFDPDRLEQAFSAYARVAAAYLREATR